MFYRREGCGPAELTGSRASAVGNRQWAAPAGFLDAFPTALPFATADARPPTLAGRRGGRWHL